MTLWLATKLAKDMKTHRGCQRAINILVADVLRQVSSQIYTRCGVFMGLRVSYVRPANYRVSPSGLWRVNNYSDIAIIRTVSLQHICCHTGVATGCTGCTCTPWARTTFLGFNLEGYVLQVHLQRERVVNFLKKIILIGGGWWVGGSG